MDSDRMYYFFEDLKPGFKYRSPVGRTITDVDNIWFSLITNNVNQIHFNIDYVKRAYPGDPFKGRLVVNGALTLAIAIGLTTPLSARGFMLSLDNVRFLKPVFGGDTLYAEAVVTSSRESKSRPGFGIVTLHTKVINQDGETVMEFDRTIMVPMRSGAGQGQEQ